MASRSRASIVLKTRILSSSLSFEYLLPRYFDKLLWNGLAAVYYPEYDNSTTYSYDIHGNVDTLLHNYRTGLMAQHSYNKFKTMAYRYDLISGKVNEVHFQPGMPDELYHRYEYDAENRLTNAYMTDRKALMGITGLEEHEAFYQYYKHGPLARAVLGEQQVQGIDYAYTLQGWLKGVNSDSLLDDDGTTGSIVSKDAYRFSLNYFNADYKAISASLAGVFPGHTAYMGVNAADYKPLYNGNISSMVVGIPKLGETKLYNFNYDQLNRIVRMDAWKGYDPATGSWSGLQKTDENKEQVSYDANGNIRTYKRNGNDGQLNMDDLTYGYNEDVNNYLTNNRLRHVKDAIGDGNYTEDIDNQADDNYEYDEIGNLIKDVKEGIDDIEWTVYGKIKKITKTNGSTISYTYDVSGNRIAKAVTTGGVTTTTWYTRDASGNVMAVYTGSGSSLTLNEQHIYGSSRLGVWNRNVDMDVSSDANNYIFTRGNKFFELSNHLGNVLVTVSDKKTGVDGNTDGTIEYYNADVVTANDYYPFGMGMPGRKYNSGNLYRYGFNGKENDNEVKGDGNHQDYGFRIYDPRLGKFLSVDPLTQEYPELTPYQFASNRPIDGIDIDGLEWGAIRMMQAKYAAGQPAQKQSNSQLVVYKQLSTPASCHGPGNSEFRVPGYSNPQTWSEWTEKNGLLRAAKAIDEASDYIPSPKILVKKGVKKIFNAIVEKSKKETPSTEKKIVDNDPTKKRVTLRKDVKEKVKENQPKNENGEMIDPNTKQPLDPNKTDVGHKPGEEWRKRKEMHKEKGSTRKEVIEEENNPDLYQLEDRHNNRSHKFEKKKEN